MCDQNLPVPKKFLAHGLMTTVTQSYELKWFIASSGGMG